MDVLVHPLVYNAAVWAVRLNCHADAGWEGLLRNLTSTQAELGPDITSLTVKADTSNADILHISITDLHDERWHVPSSLFPQASLGKPQTCQDLYGSLSSLRSHAFEWLHSSLCIDLYVPQDV